MSGKVRTGDGTSSTSKSTSEVPIAVAVREKSSSESMQDELPGVSRPKRQRRQPFPDSEDSAVPTNSRSRSNGGTGLSAKRPRSANDAPEVVEQMEQDKENVNLEKRPEISLSQATVVLSPNKSSPSTSYHTAASTSAVKSPESDSGVRRPLSDVSRKSPFSDISDSINRDPFAEGAVRSRRSKSVESVASVASAVSTKSRFSTASVASAASTFSMFSTASVASAASTKSRFSVASVASAMSRFSVAGPEMSHRQRLEWLIPRRMVGTWVQCDACDKHRYLKDHHDPSTLPERWYCHQNPDAKRNTCEAAEKLWSRRHEELIICNAFAPGSLVWARRHGFPFWWPAMVDDCPECEQFYGLDDENGPDRTPSQYHVVYLDSPPTRSWMLKEDLHPFSVDDKQKSQGLKSQMWGRQLRAAVRRAREAAGMEQVARIRRYGSLANFVAASTSAQRRLPAASVQDADSSPGSRSTVY